MNGMSSYRRRLMAGAYPKEMPNYLCFTALESGSFTFRIGSSISIADYSYIEYSVDECRTWTKVSNTNNVEVTATTPILSVGDKVYWRGSGARCSKHTDAARTSDFYSTGKFDASGDLLSILQLRSIDSDATLQSYTFYKMFYGCNVVDASEMALSLKTLPNNCFDQTFYGCQYMTYPPKIDATSAGDSAMNSMFCNCVGLLESPQINVSNAPTRCCTEMFKSCTSLVTARDIKTTSCSGSNSFSSMFYGCTSLVTAPKIYITNFNSQSNTFKECFVGCTNLETVPYLPALTLASNSYYMLCRFLSKVSYVMMLATDISASSCLNYWLQNVASTGIFVKHIDAQWTTTGINGVPSGWTIIYYDPDLDKYYLDQQRVTECDDHGNPI